MVNPADPSPPDRPVVIVGATGQDGYYLTEFLRGQGRIVHGIGRRGLMRQGTDVWVSFDISQPTRVRELIDETDPAEVYYLVAHQHSSQEAPQDPAETLRRCYAAHTDGLANFLEAIRASGSNTRLFYAASAHVFGDPGRAPQTEETPFLPINPYGITKAAGIQLCRMYRRDHGVFCSVGILYNHESPRRPESFVGRKITAAAFRIARGEQDRLVLGALDARIDWGAAEDYVTAMPAVLALDAADDFVIASGALHTVGDIVNAAFAAAGLDPATHVETDPTLMKAGRRSVPLHGDISKLTAATGWTPPRRLEEIVRAMVRAEAGEEGRAHVVGQ